MQLKFFLKHLLALLQIHNLSRNLEKSSIVESLSKYNATTIVDQDP